MRNKRACRFAPQRGIDGPVNRAAKVCSSETILEEASLSNTIAGRSAMSFRHSDGERLRSKRVYEFAQQREDRVLRTGDSGDERHPRAKATEVGYREGTFGGTFVGGEFAQQREDRVLRTVDSGGGYRRRLSTVRSKRAREFGPQRGSGRRWKVK